MVTDCLSHSVACSPAAKRLPQPLSTCDPMLMLFLTAGEEASYDPGENGAQSNVMKLVQTSRETHKHPPTLG